MSDLLRSIPGQMRLSLRERSLSRRDAQVVERARGHDVTDFAKPGKLRLQTAIDLARRVKKEPPRVEPPRARPAGDQRPARGEGRVEPRDVVRLLAPGVEPGTSGHETGVLRDLLDGNVGFAELFGGAGRGKQLGAALMQRAGEFDDAALVVGREEGSGNRCHEKAWIDCPLVFRRPDSSAQAKSQIVAPDSARYHFGRVAAIGARGGAPARSRCCNPLP